MITVLFIDAENGNGLMLSQGRLTVFHKISPSAQDALSILACDPEQSCHILELTQEQAAMFRIHAGTLTLNDGNIR